MIRTKFTSIFTCILLINLMLPCGTLSAQKRIVAAKDTTAFFQGVLVGVDLFGAVQRQVSDYGQYEAFLRLNIKGKYLPVFELGLGDAEHKEDAVTKITTKTRAPYGRIGCDFNVMKNKHDIYKLFVGVRYAYSNFDFEFSYPGVKDPAWGGVTPYYIKENNYAHWIEGVFGVDAKVVGPVHLGWTVRYRRRIGSSDSQIGDVWYIPGFGRSDKTNIGGTFNLSIGI